MLRDSILKEDFELNGRFCDASELEKECFDIAVPINMADFVDLFFMVIVYSDNIVDVY